MGRNLGGRKVRPRPWKNCLYPLPLIFRELNYCFAQDSPQKNNMEWLRHHELVDTKKQTTIASRIVQCQRCSIPSGASRRVEVANCRGTIPKSKLRCGLGKPTHAPGDRSEGVRQVFRAGHGGHFAHHLGHFRGPARVPSMKRGQRIRSIASGSECCSLLHWCGTEEGEQEHVRDWSDVRRPFMVSPRVRGALWLEMVGDVRGGID